MQNELQSLVVSVTTFAQAFGALLEASVLAQLWQQQGPKPRGQKPRLSGPQLVSALVFHILAGAGTLAAHVQQLTGLELSDSALSQRRTAAGVGVFEAIVRAALRPLAVLQEHPQAFYHGWRLIGMDGSQFSVSNTPQLLGRLSKAASRRFRAAFAKVPMSWLMELGTHAPLAVAVGLEQESEWELSHRLLSQLQRGWLVLADRLYGVAAFVNELLIATQRMGSHFLVRVRQNVKVSVRQVLSDGSALVAVAVADPWNPNRKRGCIWVREIVGRVRRANGSWVNVRLWTDLWDERNHPGRLRSGLETVQRMVVWRAVAIPASRANHRERRQGIFGSAVGFKGRCRDLQPSHFLFAPALDATENQGRIGHQHLAGHRTARKADDQSRSIEQGTIGCRDWIGDGRNAEFVFGWIADRPAPQRCGSLERKRLRRQGTTFDCGSVQDAAQKQTSHDSSASPIAPAARKARPGWELFPGDAGALQGGLAIREQTVSGTP